MSILSRLNAVAIALLFCFVTLAQKKALPGYYITVQGDTMKGIFPSYAQWNKNPGKVEFIIAGTKKPIELTPENSRKFVVDGYDEYISYTGLRLLNPIDNTTMINDRVTMGPNDSSETVVIFLRLVTRTTGGDLYVLNDAKRMNLFYQLPGQMPEELKFKKTFNQNQIKEIDIYRQQLNDLFGNLIIQKNMTASLEKLDYTEKDLMTFFLSLFPTAGPARNEHRAASKWVVSIGGALNMFKVQADKSFTAVPKTYSSSFSPVASIGFMAALDRNFGKYFLYPNISLFRYKNTGEENTGTFNSSYTYQADLIGIIALNGGINLTNEENFQFFLSAGPGMMAQVSGKQVKQLYDPSNHTPYGSAEEKSLPGLTLCIDASAGIVFSKKFVVSAIYILPTSVANFVQYNPKLSSLQLTVGYRFP